ncbi:BMC domain-containing protein [candidate division WOR-3 bacterium]|nr:BMC domain-containing protein [candidate division WOR-3 bacterium]
MEYSLGMIETKGLTAAIESADAMTKTAEVHLLGYELSTGGYVCVKIIGEVAAVKAAVETAANRSAQIGELISVHVIPRPHIEIYSIVHATTKPASTKGEKTDIKILEELSVTELRKIARNTDGIEIKGREISKSNKDKLIKEIKKVM